MDVEAQKRAAAARALAFVQPGMRLGLGTGSTAGYFVELLAERVRSGLDVVAVPTSEATRAQAERLGIALATLEETPALDLTVDGADEIAPGLALIKGGGGKLLREKIVASASRRFVVIADESKIVSTLGAAPLPVEVIPMAAPLVRRSLQELGFNVRLRMGREGSPYITDEGNLLFDCSGMLIEDPEGLAAILDRTVGLVEHGLFLHRASLAIVATEDGVIERTA
jgi:ribose 5-phosphate isomerase A